MAMMLRFALAASVLAAATGAESTCSKNYMEERLRKAKVMGAKYLERKKLEAEYDLHSVRGSSLLQVGSRTGQTTYEQGFSPAGKVVKRNVVIAPKGGARSKLAFKPPAFNPFKPDPALVQAAQR
mmetsp:Transcript_120309/g.374621  ORF Transcript_120309/g.374621 Transcript_120309/m.374621 type:complete len:125 (+) Transcript_120309:102-476(+)